MSPKKSLFIVSILVLCLLLVAACGGGKKKVYAGGSGGNSPSLPDFKTPEPDYGGNNNGIDPGVGSSSSFATPTVPKVDLNITPFFTPDPGRPMTEIEPAAPMNELLKREANK